MRPQQSPGEDVASLIDDPWQKFDCDPSPAGCSVVFSDPEYAGSARPAAYYARAFEEPAPAINAGGVRCKRDAEGRCLSVDLCGSDSDDCLSEDEPRAWSSPIWVDPPGAGS